MTDTEPALPSFEPLAEVPAPPRIWVRVLTVLGEPPWPRFGLIDLPDVPRVGDLLEIPTQFAIKVAEVNFVRFTPGNAEAPVTVGVVFSKPQAEPNSGAQPGQPDPQKAMDSAVDFHSRLFERVTNYSNLILAAGYAGLFGLWAYSKDFMSPTGMAEVGMMIGLSILTFFSYQLYGVYMSSKISVRVGAALAKQPDHFFTILKQAETDMRRASLLNAKLWAISFYTSVALAYFAGFTLFYNAVAHLTRLPQWP